MTVPRFTLADAERANDAWGCNCGPASLAAICGLTLDEVHRHFPGFVGYTNPTLMFNALGSWSKATGRTWKPSTMNATAGSNAGRTWPRYGLARIQFEGPWMQPGVPIAARYKHTHWVGARQAVYRGQPGVDVWDINALADGLGGWRPLEWWSGVIVPALTAEIRRATGGWHITHAIEIDRPTTNGASHG